MPFPKPKKGENQDDFISRCMSNETMKKEYDDNDQRLAVCYSLWEQDKKEDIPTNMETRVINLEDVDLRVEGDDSPLITGYAAKFNRFSEDLGGFKEKIHPKAFDEALKDSDVRALKNHDPNLILGRTTSGTLKLNTNTVGLRFEIDPPNTSTGKDMIEEIRRKDITGCSFAFTTAEDDWKYKDDGTIERTIVKVARLYDVGPVTYPAYPDTTVAARSLEVFKKKEVLEPEEESQEQKNIIDNDRQRTIKSKYKRMGRLLNRCKKEPESAEI